jgi:hypothetical protein
MIKRALAVMVAGGVALGGLAGLVWTAGVAGAQRDYAPAAASSAAAPADGANTGSGANADGQKPRGVGRAIHGELIVRQEDGTFGPATMDRGKVTEKSSQSFTMERPDGVKVTITVGDGTKYRGISGFDALQVGKPAIAVVKNGVAVMVGQPLPREERQANRQERQANRAQRQANRPANQGTPQA